VRYPVGLGLALYVLLASPSKPSLELRASPRISTAIVCSNVLLLAQIVGPEEEAWYCPAVEWILPDGTSHKEESDCPPFSEREEYPRLWTRRICAPPGDWTVDVRLSKDGRLLRRGSIDFWVK